MTVKRGKRRVTERKGYAYVCVCVTKLTCMRGFTVEARPLRFRRIKVTGKNQQGRKCWFPCLIYQHLAKHKQRGGVPPPAAAERRGQSHIAAALQIRGGERFN